MRINRRLRLMMSGRIIIFASNKTLHDMEENVKLYREPVAVEIQFNNEEERKLFTDSNGRVHTSVFVDKDTGAPIFDLER